MTGRHLPLWIIAAVTVVACPALSEADEAPTAATSPIPAATDATEPAVGGLKLRRRTAAPPPSAVDLALQQQALAEADARQATATRRHEMFKWHQGFGLTADALVITQAVLGTQLYRAQEGDIVFTADEYDTIRNIHLGVAIGAVTSWAAAGTIALAAPESELEQEREESGEFNRITLHKIFAAGHVAGMIASPILGGLTTYMSSKGDPNLPTVRKLHIATGYATAVFLTSAMLSIVF